MLSRRVGFVIFYAPRMPADPFARSVFIRSLYSRSLPSRRHANAHTLGGTPPPKTPPPGTPQGPPPTPGEGGEGRGPSGPRGTAYTQSKFFRMLKSLKFEILRNFGVTINYSCRVSCRILGVLLSQPCIVEAGPKRPHFCTYKPPSARPGLLSSKCGPGQCWHRPKRGRLYATKIIIWGRNCTNN